VFEEISGRKALPPSPATVKANFAWLLSNKNHAMEIY
jgi:hypothetical protein